MTIEMSRVATEATDSPFGARLAELLTTRSFGRSLRWLESVTSTNTLATEWAEGDAEDGAIICAELQTAGRGRFQRSWVAERGENLTFSVILFPGLAADRLGMISIAFAVAVASTLQQSCGLKGVEIKWPNDILVEGRKICGMLQESAFPSGRGRKRVVVGIGLNVNQSAFSPDVAENATSIKLASGREFDRVELLAALLGEMESLYHALHTGKESTVRARYEARLSALGRRVSFVRLSSGKIASGVVTGIDRQGGLVVSTPNGKETVFAGEVSFRTEAPRG